jgi:rare lipoprotein A
MVRLAQRQVALAAVALLAVVVSLAVSAFDDDGDRPRNLPEPVAMPDGWYPALAAPRARQRQGRATACGHVLSADTLGISHPVLPCGAKVFLSYAGKEVLTQVIDRGPSTSGYQFDLTRALAEKLGLRGIQLVHWTFARRTPA